jgi:hypothetical protein
MKPRFLLPPVLLLASAQNKSLPSPGVPVPVADERQLRAGLASMRSRTRSFCISPAAQTLARVAVNPILN